MAEDDPESVDGVDPAEQPAPEEDLVGDPELAAEIAEMKLAQLGGDVIFPRHASCGRAGVNIDDTLTADAASPNSANQRSGSSTGCTVLGVLQPTDNAAYWCFTFGNDGFTWTYLRNTRTNVKGWVRDDLLRDNGSFDHCGF